MYSSSTPEGRKVIVFIAMSLDGFIAGENENLDFLGMVEKEGEDYGYASFIRDVDAVIMGRKTYEKVQSMGIENPHPEKEFYILTRKKRASEGNRVFYNDNPEKLVQELKKRSGRNIFIDGGAEIVNRLVRTDSIDEYIVSVVPVLLGQGVRLFSDENPEQGLHLVECRSYEKGLVQLHYKR